jgi:hypothetical protein
MGIERENGNKTNNEKGQNMGKHIVKGRLQERSPMISNFVNQ